MTSYHIMRNRGLHKTTVIKAKPLLAYLVIIIIQTSNDINPNPGPDATIYPCGTCDQPVTWDDKGIVCDTCNHWYHTSCQSMGTRSYNEFANDSAIAWDCIMCGCPNYSTLCYSLILSTSNHFSVLSDTSLASPTPTNNIRPIHASTPDRKKSRPSKEKTPLRILNVNFQSIKGKQGQVRNLINSTNPDIIFGTETWIDSNIKDSQIFPPGYNIFRKDRHCSGGGVLIAVRDIFIATSVPELQTDCEIVWCKLELVGHKAVYLSCFYNPKTSNEHGYLELERSIVRADNISNAFIITAGDFNLPGWDWKTKSLKPNTQHSNIHHKFTDVLDDHGLVQLVEEPTRESNTLDLIITNHPNCFNRIETLPGLSDHDIVFAELNTIPSKHNN